MWWQCCNDCYDWFRKIQNKKIDHIKSNTEEVFDVTGAGDTVISLFSASVAAGNDYIESAHFANIGASIVVKKLGIQ